MKVRNILISLFVVIWLAVFHYESVRYFYLQPFFKQPLPKMKMLFPPAGWIMFYNVDDRYGNAEIFGIKGNAIMPIDPHQIIKTRFVGFDMVQRNVLGSILNREVQPGFCRYLKANFSEFDRFVVTAVEYSNLSQTRYDRRQTEVYSCP